MPVESSTISFLPKSAFADVYLSEGRKSRSVLPARTSLYAVFMSA